MVCHSRIGFRLAHITDNWDSLVKCTAQLQLGQCHIKDVYGDLSDQNVGEKFWIVQNSDSDLVIL